jgi:hypothetical protein
LPFDGRQYRTKWQFAQPAAKLRFTYTAVAEEQDLDLRVDPLAEPKVLVVGAAFVRNVLIRGLAA